MDGGPTLSQRTMSPGAITGVVIAAVVMATFIGALVFFIQRYYATHTRVIPNQRGRSQVLPSAHHNNARSSPQEFQIGIPRNTGTSEVEPYGLLDRAAPRATQPHQGLTRNSVRSSDLSRRNGHRLSNGYPLQRTRCQSEFTDTSLPHQPHSKEDLSSVTQERRSSGDTVASAASSHSPANHNAGRRHRLSDHSVASSDASAEEASGASIKSTHYQEGIANRCSSAGTTVSARDVHLCGSADDIEALEI